MKALRDTATLFGRSMRHIERSPDTIITVAIPLKLKTHFITMGWFVEAGALIYIGRRLNSALLRVLESRTGA